MVGLSPCTVPNKFLNLRGEELVFCLHDSHDLLQGSVLLFVHSRDERADGIPITGFGPAPAWEWNGHNEADTCRMEGIRKELVLVETSAPCSENLIAMVISGHDFLPTV